MYENLHSEWSFIFSTLFRLLSPPNSSGWCSWFSHIVVVSLFVSNRIALFLFVAFIPYALPPAISRDTCGDCVNNCPLVRFKKAKPSEAQSKTAGFLKYWKRQTERQMGDGGRGVWRWGKYWLLSFNSESVFDGRFGGSFTWKLRCSGVLTAENIAWVD